MRHRPATTVALSLLLLAAPGLVLAPGAHAGNANGTGELTIAILDTGLDAGHTEFTGCDDDPLVAWKDFAGGLGQPADPVGHGTAVASVAVGATLGESPCSPFLAGRVCDEDGCSLDAVRAGIQWAVDQGADVINLSLGTIVPIPELLFDLSDELAEAREAGALVVVAAGNGAGNLGLVPFPSETGQPAGSHQVLVAGSSDEVGNPAVGHNLDPEVIQAGVRVAVAQAGTNDGTMTMSGTSFAAPNVAGIALEAQKAHHAAHGFHLTPDDLEDLIKLSALDRLQFPYAMEGWGFTTVDRATQAAAAGTPDGAPCYDSSTPTIDRASDCQNLAAEAGAQLVRIFW